MTQTPGKSFVVPLPRIPRVLGILNIVFSSELMICGLCLGSYFNLVIPLISPALERMQRQVITQQENYQRATLESLAEEAKAAKTEQEKREIETRRKEIEARPRAASVTSMDMKQYGIDDPMLRRWTWVEFLSGLVLNVLLMASGIALVRRRTWGLKVGIGVAAAKLIRLVLLYGYVAVNIVPGISLKSARVAYQEVIRQQQTSGGPAIPNLYENLARIYAVLGTGLAVTIIVIGAIYPVVSLWLLTRPGAWAACSEGERPLAKGESW